MALSQKWKLSDDLLVCSDRRHSFFGMFNVPVRICRDQEAPAIFEEFQPHSVFTGTSYTSSLELNFLREAAKRSIHSTSFIDHYTEFRRRFQCGDESVFPDEIHVLDKKAAGLAVCDGLPEQRIRITGNPYHEFLRNWQPSVSGKELWHNIGLAPSPAKTILFAPDPLSNAGGLEKFGTDESIVFEILLRALGQIDGFFRLLTKEHPNQRVDSLLGVAANGPRNVECIFVSSEHDSLLNDLMCHSGLVVGMFSGILVEAELLGATTVRILSGLKVDDPLAGQTSGEVVLSEQDLPPCLAKHLK